MSEMTDSRDTNIAVERQKAMILDYAKLNQLILTDLKKNQTTESTLTRYKRSEVATFLENPHKYEKQLRNLSTILYNKSPHYKRLIQYFANMPVLSYIVEPVNIDFTKYNVKSLSSQYKKTVQFLENMNIAHEFSKILKVVFREDVFYGYEHIGKNSYFIQRLDPEYCRISSIEDGVYNFAFDFSYFRSNLDKLETYPKEFKNKYNKYQKDQTLKWQELDPKATICIKANEETEALIPPFVAVFESLFEIEDFKALRMDKEEISNYKVLIQKLPIRENTENNNDFMIDYENMIMFHNKAAQALPEKVALITTPMDIKDITFERDGVDKDSVEKATRDYWTGTGVSQLLFNTDQSSSIGLSNSIKTDEEIVFALLRQIERWINRRLKFMNTNTNFKVSIPNITIFNRKEYFDNAISAAQYGFPTRSLVAAALGMSPSSLVNMTLLENEILGLTDKMTPLSSSHTQSSNTSEESSAGRRALDDSEIGDEALAARDGEKGT